jgi:hypothetical protein
MILGMGFRATGRKPWGKDDGCLWGGEMEMNATKERKMLLATRQERTQKKAWEAKEKEKQKMLLASSGGGGSGGGGSGRGKAFPFSAPKEFEKIMCEKRRL